MTKQCIFEDDAYLNSLFQNVNMVLLL